MFKMFMNRAKYESTKKSEKEKRKHFFRFFFWGGFFLTKTVSVGLERKQNILAMVLLNEWTSWNYVFAPV